MEAKMQILFVAVVLCLMGTGFTMADERKSIPPNSSSMEVSKSDGTSKEGRNRDGLPPLIFPQDDQKYPIKSNKTAIDYLQHHLNSSEKAVAKKTEREHDDEMIEEAKKEDQDYYHDSSEEDPKSDVSQYQPKHSSEDKDELEEKFGESNLEQQSDPMDNKSNSSVGVIVVASLVVLAVATALSTYCYIQRKSLRHGERLINEDEENDSPNTRRSRIMEMIC